MVYHRASSSRGAVSSRISLRTDGAISAMPISSGSSISPLGICWFSSIREKLAAGDTTHHCGEDVIEETDEKRDSNRNKDDDEGVADRRTIRRPNDMGELFAYMLQVDEW